uniref:Peptidase C1A papain C-terminal domain-containing protein n=1 Tax=Clastoptera arizonana TaxID=38151 RepID=A0A1B6E818_9HEMI
MHIMLFTVILYAVLAVTYVTAEEPLESDDIIKYVNSATTTWKAGRNFHPDLTKGHLRRLLGLRKKNRPNVLPLKESVQLGKIPKSFDARDEWSFCTSLQEVRDQGDCGSCWAVAAAAAFTDRYCIATNGSWNGHLSAEELMTCCDECGYGCDGGYDDMAWQYFQENGIVTGGDFGSKEGCQPYKKQPCEHHVNGSRVQCSDLGPPTTPKCKSKCITKKIHFKKDHKKVSSTYYFNDVKQAQQDILTYGPLEAGFDVYADFLSYKSGVYQYTTGEYLGGHAVKVIGWGVEKKVPYWLVANSWNTDWGDNGFFKIKRGSDDCSFEDDLSGGIPDV